MIEDIGAKIRNVRRNRGISLNTYAEKLGISPAYLSNLETGKTDTIQLSLLAKLQADLKLLPIGENLDISQITDVKLSDVIRQLIILHKEEPFKAALLTQLIEDAFKLMSLQIFSSHQDNEINKDHISL
jgi:transcriptional regulator with XRE-family HTH domain